MKKLALRLTFAVALIAVIAAMAPATFAQLKPDPGGCAWVSYCPPNAPAGAQGPVVGHCTEVSYCLGCTRNCDVIDVNGTQYRTRQLRDGGGLRR